MNVIAARAAEHRDEEARDDGGGEAALGWQAARDRERNGERQRDDADDHAGDHVPGELLPIIILNGREKLGDEHGDPIIRDSGMCTTLQ